MAASAYHVNLKEVKNWSFRHNFIFRHIHINNPYWLELPENFIRASWEIKKERPSYIKKYIEEFVWGTSFFWLHALFSMSFFVTFFAYFLPFVYSSFTKKKIYLLQKTGVVVVVVVVVCVCVCGGGRVVYGPVLDAVQNHSVKTMTSLSIFKNDVKSKSSLLKFFTKFLFKNEKYISVQQNVFFQCVKCNHMSN